MDSAQPGRGAVDSRGVRSRRTRPGSVVQVNQPGDSDEPGTPASGMGGPERGPSFTFGSPPGFHGDPATGSTPLGTGPLPVPPTPGPPPRSRVGALVTLGVVLVVVLVAVVATVVADRQDARRPAAVTTSVAPTTATSSAPKGSIDFTSSRGSGRLRVVEHTWSTTAGEPNSRLVVDIEISASSGRVDYDPYAFQAFDARGQLYDIASDTTRTPLEVGSLVAGESTRGFLEFDLPRGEVTLLMSNDNFGSVTALRIDD